MRRLALLLITGGAVWLFLAALPVLADNGPHVRRANGLTADSCAGCHRAHTAANPMLTLDAQPALCYTCHGTGGTGSNENVQGGTAFGATTGALRGGGVEYALLDTSNPTRYGFGPGNGLVGTTTLEPTTSHHAVGFTDEMIWGNGPIVGPVASSQGTLTELRCGSCHNPHGELTFRILRGTPVDSGVANRTITSATVANPTAITTSAAHGFTTGQAVTITGSNSTPSINGTYRVTVTGATTFTIPVDVTVAGTAGTASTRVYVPDVTQWTPGPTGTLGANQIPTGVLPAGAAYVYTTTNYWRPQDPNWLGSDYVAQPDIVCTGPGTPAGCGSTAVAGSIVLGTDSREWLGLTTQWCAACHTRYNAPTEAYEHDSGDAIFHYRHPTYAGALTDSTSAPACLQCHVSHGTNASMGTNSANVKLPGTSTTPAETSRLLRVDSRGVCQLCHFR